MTVMSVSYLEQQLEALGASVLTSGAHEPGSGFCALEFEAAVRGRPWSDEPITLPDLRSLNDGPWSSDVARTEALLPVMVALWDWAAWAEPRRRRWTTDVILATCQQILATLPSLPNQVRAQCCSAQNVPEVVKAAQAAWTAAGATTAVGRAAMAMGRAAKAMARAAATTWTATETTMLVGAVEAAARGAAEAAAAAWAARAVRRAAPSADRVLGQACQIWINACVTESDGLDKD